MTELIDIIDVILRYKSRPTQRAADGGESPAKTGIFKALSVFCCQAFVHSRPPSAANANRWAAEIPSGHRKGFIERVIVNSQIDKFIDKFEKNPSIEPALIQQAVQNLGFDLPSDYLTLISQMNGGEGFIGDKYCRFYSIDKLIALNQAFMVKDFAPGLFIFGSTGGGEAFTFDTRNSPASIVEIPFIPMDIKYAKVLGKTILDFFIALSGQSKNETPHAINMDLIGKEVHEIQPIVFGGNPVDPKNKTFLIPEDYAKLVVWWNKQYQKVVASK